MIFSRKNLDKFKLLNCRIFPVKFSADGIVIGPSGLDALKFVGLHISAIEDVVYIKVEPVAVVGESGSDASLGESAAEVVAGDDAAGVASGDVVEIAGHDDISHPDGVDLLSEQASLDGALAEGSGEFAEKLMAHGLDLSGSFPLGEAVDELLVVVVEADALHMDGNDECLMPVDIYQCASEPRVDALGLPEFDRTCRVAGVDVLAIHAAAEGKD